MVAWTRLIRFLGEDGKVYRGEPIVDEGTADIGKSRGLKARIITGENIFKGDVTDKVVNVKQLLGPLDGAEVHEVRCVGLNYATHSNGFMVPLFVSNAVLVKEAGRKLPPFPFHFLKPGTCIADFGAPVAIPRIAQDSQADYEGELVLVIGEDCKNVDKDDALSYVAAYTSGDDVSARTWQRDAGLLTFSKGFDKFAPLGPCLVSSKVRSSSYISCLTLIG